MSAALDEHAAYLRAVVGAGPPDQPSRPDRPAPAPLGIRPLAAVAADVDARGPRRWLIRGVWPAADYGVLGAEPKAGKTWTAVDLAVSVATGTPWLGTVPIDTPGPVLLFAGEGGDGNVVRRFRAVADSRGHTAEALPVHVCTRAPHLTDADHLAQLAAAVDTIRPVLVILDPLYLAARGANGADLYAMGAVLETPQRICQTAGAALLVVTHFNRQRDQRGAARFTGAGPAEWGRVLIAGTIAARHTDPATRATTVVTEWDVTGGEVPDQTLRIRRVITADDPDDLDSPLRYTVDQPDDTDTVTTQGAGRDLAPAARKLLAAVTAADQPTSSRHLVDWIATEYGNGLTRETASRHLNDLQARGLIDHLDDPAASGRFPGKLWFPTKPDTA